MKLALNPPLAPMEARAVDDIPEGEGWQYEPKWDGFRCIAFRDGDSIELQSKAGQPLTRYFPEIVASLAALKAERFVLDGEIAIPQGNKLSFVALLQRIHPAASRIRKLAQETPGIYIVFDLLADAKGNSLLQEALAERRQGLEAFAAKYLKSSADVKLSPATTKFKEAEKWFRGVGGALDGIMAKQLNMPYHSGERDAMVKIKCDRTADCVVGGFRYATKGEVVGSLLLGLYDDDGLLHHVGFTSSFKAAERKAITEKVEKLIKEPGFTGRRPGGPSRWSTERSGEWCPLASKLVVEVSYDHFSGDRFRHGTKLVRWRPDKAPRQCTMEQVRQAPSAASLRLLRASS